MGTVAVHLINISSAYKANCSVVIMLCWRFTYTPLIQEEPSLPGPTLVAPLRMLCGPGLSTKLQSFPA